jgi:hypothetical protein
MILNQKILAAIFGDASKFCGKEDVLHALIYYHIVQSGVPSTQVAREHSIANKKIDLVVFDGSINGQFYGTNIKPKCFIEVKGGAYGNRNALADEISFDGYCTDMDKLKQEAKDGTEAWFICVDMPELGRALSPGLVQKVQNQCRIRNISFAYYCQGENYFFYAPLTNTQSNEKVSLSSSNSNLDMRKIFNPNNSHFNKMVSTLRKINGHEANTTAALYELFRNSGLGTKQISLETYFSFAKKPGSTMHDRPDLVLFDEHFDGLFNLYKNGNRNMSNDAHKLKSIKSIIEVKGSNAMNSLGVKARMNKYVADIEKLHNWQSMAKSKGCDNLPACFFCLDGHRTPLPRSSFQQMIDQSAGNQLVYVSHNGIELAGF